MWTKFKNFPGQVGLYLKHRVLEGQRARTLLVSLKSGNMLTIKHVTNAEIERGPNGVVAYTIKYAPWAYVHGFQCDPTRIEAIYFK